MRKLFEIAIRNLVRNRRRTILTGSLIAVGIIAVVVFGAVAGAFKGMMIAQFTDAVLGDLEVHRRGYVASIDNLPLTLNLSAQQVTAVERALQSIPEVEVYSPRVKLGAMFSNYLETTSIRLNGVDPEREFATVPLLPSRIKGGAQTIRKGEILIPDLLAQGMKVKVGSAVVVIATNQDGSVNALQLAVGGVLVSAAGPSGRDAYIHMDDARELLRMEELEISEIAIGVREPGRVNEVYAQLTRLLASQVDAGGKPVFEVHTWEGLSPFSSIARMIDLLAVFIKVALVAIVLISVMNVMLMAVYERIREIGTIAAMGTLPGKILAMFVIEGFSLGVFGTVVGGALGSVIVLLVRAARPTFDFARVEGLVLAPVVTAGDLLVVSGIVVLVSVLASLQPAFKASRMEPVEALRHA
ncbi:MAG: ABC transporter permease [Gemmatimonadetes bacterium]|nr:ABC transporter permease [Gemmatimonadota bacterium]